MAEPRTKLVCTLGPATAGPKAVRALAEAGADVFRVNFSHVTPDSRREAVGAVRKVEREVGVPLAVMADLPGPKVRLGPLFGEQLHLFPGRRFLLRTEGRPGDQDGASVTYPGLVQDVQPGDRILLADGAVELVVIETEGFVATEVVRGGTVRAGAGVNVPAERLSLLAITERDRECLAEALDLQVDLVAQSFVRKPADVDELRSLMGAHPVPVVAKIETGPAVQEAEELCRVADAIMVARGDLGVELPMEVIPLVQKELLRKARSARRPTIVATQMLESMCHAPRPTRAEANDVANAVLDGADAVMLSAETAIGEYPVEAATAATRITELADRRGGPYRAAPPPCTHQDDASTVTHAAAAAASEGRAVAIACFTGSGRTARLLSAERPVVPIYAFAPDLAVRRRLALQWGTSALEADEPGDTDQSIAAMEEGLLRRELARPGDVVVMVASAPFGEAHTNLMKLHTLGG